MPPTARPFSTTKPKASLRDRLRSSKVAGLALTTVLAGTLLTVGGSAPASAAEPTPRPPVAFQTAPEKPSRYFAQVSCDPSEKPGAQAMRDLIRQTYGSANAGGIVRACNVGGTSEHKEGRAYDWSRNVSIPNQKAQADAMVAFLTGPDAQGVSGGNAHRLGLQYVIWNRRIWNSGSGWKAYSGASPHTDHVHFSFSWDGAFKRTSWYTGTAVTRVDYGPCVTTVGVLARPYSGPNYSPCPAAQPPVKASFGNLESVRVLPGGFTAQGWVINPNRNPAEVHSYAAGMGLATKTNQSRPDVDAAYPGTGTNHGFTTGRNDLPEGTHNACFFAYSDPGASSPSLGCRSINVRANAIGNLESVVPAPGGVNVVGWVIDGSTADPTEVHIYARKAGTNIGAPFVADKSRPDVANAFAGYGDRHGFNNFVALPTGTYDVCAYSIDKVGASAGNPVVGCRTVPVA